MRFHLVLAVAGCNSVFGVHQTEQAPVADAQFFDAPSDAPYACPQIGTAPVFKKYYHQALDQSCSGYTTSPRTNLATAMCVAPSVVREGAIDGPMTVSTFASPPSTSGAVYRAKLGPDGDVLLVRRFDTIKNAFTISLYERTAETWTYRYDALVPTVDGSLPSTPTRGASARRFLLYFAVNQGEFHEIVETSPGVWSDLLTHTTTELGVDAVFDVNLSPDGLRIVFGGGTSVSTAIFYADRARVGDPFGHTTPFDLPAAYGAFMTEDCGRMYFEGLGTIFYVSQ